MTKATTKKATASGDDWLTAMAQTMGAGIIAAEAGVPAEELRTWLEAMDSAAKSLDG